MTRTFIHHPSSCPCSFPKVFLFSRERERDAKLSNGSSSKEKKKRPLKIHIINALLTVHIMDLSLCQPHQWVLFHSSRQLASCMCVFIHAFNPSILTSARNRDSNRWCRLNLKGTESLWIFTYIYIYIYVINQIKPRLWNTEILSQSNGFDLSFGSLKSNNCTQCT